MFWWSVKVKWDNGETESEINGAMDTEAIFYVKKYDINNNNNNNNNN